MTEIRNCRITFDKGNKSVEGHDKMGTKFLIDFKIHRLRLVHSVHCSLNRQLKKHCLKRNKEIDCKTTCVCQSPIRLNFERNIFTFTEHHK